VGLIAAAGMALASFTPTVAAAPTKRHAAAKIPVRCKKHLPSKGTIKFSDWQFPDNLNPYQTQASVSFETIYAIYDPLTQYNEAGKVLPILLQKLPTVKNGGVKNGGKTVVATLKKGLRWSDGSEIVAQDVKFGWQMASLPSTGPYCKGSCDVISRVDTKGKYGLTFHLKEIYAPFIPNGLPPVWPHKWAGAWGNNDINAGAAKLWGDNTFNFEDTSYPTNGPYQVTEFHKDDRIILKPMKYYGTMTCGPRVATLIFAFYSSKEGMIAAAQTHDTDVTTDYTLGDIPVLQGHKDAYNLNNDPGFLIEHLTFNLDKTWNGKPNPLVNLKVRQALALGLDKQGLIQSALQMSAKDAQGIMAWTPLILTKELKQPFADAKLKGQWDPIAKKYQTLTGKGQALADAKKLLQQSGFGSGFTLDAFTTSGNPIRQAQFAVIQKSWSNIGVSFNPTYVPAGKLFGGWDDGGTLQHGDFQVSMYADVGYPDPDGLKFDFQSQYIDREKDVHTSINANVGGIHDASFDKAFDKAAASFDKKVRQKWYNVWQVGLNKKAYWVPLFYRGQINTDDGKVGNFKGNPTNAGNQWNTWEWFLQKGKS